MRVEAARIITNVRVELRGLAYVRVKAVQRITYVRVERPGLAYVRVQAVQKNSFVRVRMLLPQLLHKLILGTQLLQT